MTSLPSGWWCCAEALPLPGAEQMARDAGLRALAASLDAPVLRLYSWDPACISFGAHEAAARRFSAEAIAALGLDAVRRPTGGRAVLHRADLTYAVAMPLRFGVTAAQLLDGVHEIFASALRTLGLEAAPAPRRRAPAPDGGGICFDAALGGELLLDGGKVLGSAQHHSAGGVLQHGSLLLVDAQHDLRGALAVSPLSTLDSSITTVAAELQRAVSFTEMSALLIDAWAAATGPLRILDEERIAGEAAAHRAQFADPAWTWRR